MTHLYVDISAHGLGHLAQVAPVLAALRARRDGLRLTVASALPRQRLAARIAEPFVHLPQASDIGFVMHNAVDIDFAESARQYREFHADWGARVEAQASSLSHLEADLLLANAAYLPLAAAAKAGVPAVGFCSLNWADMFRGYFGHDAWATPIHAQMLAAYNAARHFLCVTPGMPMADFANRREIGPIALRTTMASARDRLGDSLQLPSDDLWVLVAMGGMEFRLPIERWPRLPGVTWLCPAAWAVQRDDVRAFDAVEGQWRFIDILAACDAVLTKPGYGTFVEAACNGVPVLYLPRDDWPEEEHLVRWMQAHGRIAAVSRPDLMAGVLAEPLRAVLAPPAPPLPAPTGVAQAAEVLLTLLPPAKGSGESQLPCDGAR